MNPAVETFTTNNAAERFVLLVRLFAHAADAGQAAVQESALLSALTIYAPRVLEPPAPYWKMPELYEHYLALTPANRASFEALIALADGHWWVMRDIECEAVWNITPGHVFLLPDVSWAEIKLIHAAPTTAHTE